MTTTFYKVAFSNDDNWTAGLVLGPEVKKMTVSEISRLFPYSESWKMHKLHISPPRNSWLQAFDYNFNATTE